MINLHHVQHVWDCWLVKAVHIQHAHAAALAMLCTVPVHDMPVFRPELQLRYLHPAYSTCVVFSCGARLRPGEPKSIRLQSHQATSKMQLYVTEYHSGCRCHCWWGGTHRPAGCRRAKRLWQAAGHQQQAQQCPGLCGHPGQHAHSPPGTAQLADLGCDRVRALSMLGHAVPRDCRVRQAHSCFHAYPNLPLLPGLGARCMG